MKKSSTFSVQCRNIISQANDFGIGAQLRIANHQDLENYQIDPTAVRHMKRSNCNKIYEETKKGAVLS